MYPCRLEDKTMKMTSSACVCVCLLPCVRCLVRLAPCFVTFTNKPNYKFFRVPFLLDDIECAPLRARTCGASVEVTLANTT